MLPNFNGNGPCYELLSSSTDLIKYWKQKGKITREFETHSKSYVYYLQFGGVSVLSIPFNEKHSLQITNSCLLFQFILFNLVSYPSTQSSGISPPREGLILEIQFFNFQYHLTKGNIHFCPLYNPFYPFKKQLKIRNYNLYIFFNSSKIWTI